MPEEQKQEEQTEEVEEQETQEEGPEDANEEGTEGNDSESSEDEGEDSEEEDPKNDELPDWAREKLTKANSEAANYRKKLRDAEDKLKSAKSPEEVDEIINQLQTDREEAEVTLLKENVALKFKLKQEAWEFLNGSNRDELEASAKKLAELAGTDDDDEDLDLEGGLTPRSRDSSAEDPRSLAEKHGHRRRR